jgi:hypothetical protein
LHLCEVKKATILRNLRSVMLLAELFSLAHTKARGFLITLQAPTYLADIRPTGGQIKENI